MHSNPFSRPGILAHFAVFTLFIAPAASFTLDGGLVAFDVGTNISAVSVHGKTTQVRGAARVRKNGAQVLLEEVNASVPVEALSTGMGLRDEHMRKYIFTTSDQKVPELKFSGENMACPAEASGDASCQVTGKMTIRGVEKPITIGLKMKAAGGAYRAIADGTVKLSDYGIERPSQFGVKCSDEVKIHIELQGREGGEALSAKAGGGK